jgi:flagellin-specific chaperone FliS
MRAASAYRASAALASSPAQILYALHARASDAIGAALFAYRAGALDQMCLHVERALAILSGLRVLAEKADAVARPPLERYYALQMLRVSRASRGHETEKRFAAARDDLDAFCKNLK